MQTVRQLAMGYSNSQIAERLFISLSTVKIHVQAILEALRVNNRTQAAVIAAYFLKTSPEEVVKRAGRQVD